jgi:hypothetical protein
VGAQVRSSSFLACLSLITSAAPSKWHRHGMVRGVLYTDGAKYVADRAGAYWLFDEIAP